MKHRHSLGERVGLCKLDIRGVSPMRDISHKIKDFGESSQKFLIFPQPPSLK